MKKPISPSISVRIPATSANLGPGFDTLGVALKLYNTVTVRHEASAPAPRGMIAETATRFFAETEKTPFPFAVTVKGNVPPARGLGSSVTLRLGVATGLNVLCGEPLSPEALLGLVVELEGHPDNAVPAFYGGFASSSSSGRYFRTAVASQLQFIGLVPDFELETKKARAVLPKSIPMADAIANLQYATLITAAFAQRNYEQLSGLFEDRWHQPYRAPLIPCWGAARAAARRAGALAFYLSGAGSTLMALTLGEPQLIADAFMTALRKTKVKGSIFVTQADNQGMKILPPGK